MTVEGSCLPRFQGLAAVLTDALAVGTELGASVAVTIDGETVVDLWGGWCDAGRSRPWTSGTTVNVWSLTKTVTTLAALLLVDAGELDLDAEVRSYWPEFAAQGKDAVLVSHILSHSSGVPAWDHPCRVEDLYDAEHSTARLAAQAPWWTPGSAPGYHSVSYGHLVGELIRRITGQSLREVVAQHIAAPLGADFGIGATGPCVAELVPPPPAGFDVESLDHDSVVYKTLTGPWIEAQVAATSGWQHAEIGSSNGYASALALARILSVLAGTGEHAGGRLLSAGTVAEVFRPRSAGIDLVLGTPIEYGLGFGLSRPDAFPFLPNGGQCYWGGWGGSLVVIDPRHRMSFAYVMNTMAASLLGSPTSAALAQALYAAF